MGTFRQQWIIESFYSRQLLLLCLKVILVMPNEYFWPYLNFLSAFFRKRKIIGKKDLDAKNQLTDTRFSYILEEMPTKKAIWYAAI